MSYFRFAAMIATSTIVMFGLMYLNTSAVEQVRFSQTRAWMALVMGTMWDAWMLRRQTADKPDQRFYHQFSVAFLAAMIGYLAAGMFLSRTYIQPLYVMLGLGVALRLTYQEEHGVIAGAFEVRHLRLAALVCLASIPALWIMIRFLI